MAHALPTDNPWIEQTDYSRESIIAALRDERDLPTAEIAAATLYADLLIPDILALLERVQHDDLDVPSDRLLFRGIHILGAGRVSAAYRPLVAFLRGPQDRVETLLGDAITENLSEILAGMFDGDEGPLCELIVDASVGPFVREATLAAAGAVSYHSPYGTHNPWRQTTESRRF